MRIVLQDHYHDVLVLRVFLNITGCDVWHESSLVPLQHLDYNFSHAGSLLGH